jgi:hypothetical protein
LEVVTIFTNVSGHGTAVYYTKDCHKVEYMVFASVQRAELYAVVNLFFQLRSLVRTTSIPVL